MPDEAQPSSHDAPREGADAPRLEFEPLALEPLVPPPAFAQETVAVAAPAPHPSVVHVEAPEDPKTRAVRRQRMGTSLLTSIAIHFAFFALLFLLLPGRKGTPEPEEEPVRISIRGYHWVGDDPEAEGSGPRGPGPNEPPPEPPKGRDVAPGFLDDDRLAGASVGVGGGAAGSAFAGRVDGKDGLVAAGGGDGGTEGAVHMALEWLARHQEKDGTWNASRYVKRCQGDGCAGASDEEYVTATTALALLPFLGAGHTYRDGPWKDVVRRGLTALHDRQRPDGRFATGQKHVYGDAFATLALAEAYGLTRNEEIGATVERSVAMWVKSQSEEGGWRYDPGSGAGDSSVTGWVAMALASARKAGIAVPEKTLARCRGWFRDHTGDDGALGYTARGTGTKSLLGVGYFVQVMLGARPDDPGLAATAGLLEMAAPRWPASDDDPAALFGAADPLHWYYGSLAAFQRGGTTWKLWNEKLRPLLVGHQERRGCAAGSWPPVGQTGAKGGRVVVTALCALGLEVYYRYPRVTTVGR